MVVLCARFAFLACLCSLVAINLRPANAAYIEADHRGNRQVAHPYSAVSEQQRAEAPTLHMPDDMVSRHSSRTHVKGSAKKSESSKNKAHKQGFNARPLAGLRNFAEAQVRRNMGLSPLLPRAFIGRAHGHHDHDHNHDHDHDHNHDHDHDHEHDHDHSKRIADASIHGTSHTHDHELRKRSGGHDEAFRSVFARHRRAPAGFVRHQARRASFVVSGDDGKKYVFSRASSGHGDQRTVLGGKGETPRHGHDRRQSNQVLGTIDIMAPGQTPGTGQRIASLLVDPSPANSTSGQNNTEAFALSASTTNQTQFLMALVDDPSDSAGTYPKNVVLAMPVFDASSAESVMYCATYDPNPSASSSTLVMARCLTTSSSTTDASGTGAAFAPIAGFGDYKNALASDPHTSQLFSYDPASGQIQPTSASANNGHASGDANATSLSAKHVVRDDGNSTVTASSGATTSSTATATAPSPTSSQQAQNVTLVFVPAMFEVPAVVPSTATASDAPGGNDAVVTTTVTETVFAMVTTSDASTTSSAAAAEATSGATATSTTPVTSSSAQSTANESLKIEVVPATPAPTSTSTAATSSVTASSSTTLNAEAVASSVANVSTRTTSVSSTTPTTTSH